MTFWVLGARLNKTTATDPSDSGTDQTSCPPDTVRHFPVSNISMRIKQNKRKKKKRKKT